VPIVLDRHDYTWPAPAEQVAFWLPILRRVNDPEMVMVDLMNEPRGFNDPVLINDYMQWVRDTNVIVAGIRQAGFRHRILVEWPQWSASFRFDKKEGPKNDCGSAACAMDRTPGGLVDPLNRIILSPHRYLDKGGSGQSGTCTDIPAQAGNLREFAASARKRGYRAVLGEYAFGSYRGIPTSCAVLGANVIAALKADSDVWLDAMAWGGGRAWKDDYTFKVEPPKSMRSSVPMPDYVKMIAGR
jgi:endoglucanase